MASLKQKKRREIDVNPQKGINIRSTSIQKYIVFVLKYQFWTILRLYRSLFITRVSSLEKSQKVSSWKKDDNEAALMQFNQKKEMKGWWVICVQNLRERTLRITGVIFGI